MNYYRLEDNILFPSRWYLGDIHGVDNVWGFTEGKKLQNIPSNLKIEVYQDGSEMDFTLAEGTTVPIVSDRLKDVLSEFDQLSFYPVQIENKTTNNKYFIMMVEETIACVDENRSEFEKFLPNDPIRPDLAGEYSAFFKLIVDSNQVANQPIFRLHKFVLAILINEEVKLKIESFKGVEFSPCF